MNGQRPNSNNMTIDGVANIDTGDNGGNMATTNIDAVAEFKVLTNAYQAEYGRAVGGQVQVVTKSGTQDFHGSGYWYGRRSDWNANTWTNKRVHAGDRARPKTSRNDSGYTIGGPVFIPGTFNADKKKLFFFLSQEFQTPHATRPASGRRRVPTALERRGDFSQSVDNSGNPFPYIRDYQLARLTRAARPTRAAASRTAACSARIPASRLYQPGLDVARASIPTPNFSGGSGINFTSQDPEQLAAPRGAAPHGLPGHGQLALHRPLHEDQGRHPAGLRHDLGRQRQRPAPDADALHASRARTTCCPRPAS